MKIFKSKEKNKFKSLIIQWLLFISVVATIISYQDWKQPYKVFGSDGISYYAYLPLAFIYHDLKMTFYDRNDLELRSRFHYYPKPTPTGHWVIPTSYGLALLQSPFFFLAHSIALAFGMEASGYSLPYEVGMLIGTLFYFLIGLVFFRKFLLSVFSDKITGIVMILIVLGTNLFHYATTEPLMAHVYSFSAIAVFLYLSIKWHEKPGIYCSLSIGALLGIISLLRPTNMIVVLFFLLWNIKSWGDIKLRILTLLKNFKLILLMSAAFIFLWIPQLIYWKHVSGNYLFWSYGETASFFFNNPQISDVLFSYRKGWLLYTPIMTFALIGIPLLWKYQKNAFLSITAVTILAVYIISSWWSWWYGCSFGQRPFVDYYAVFAVALGTFMIFIDERAHIIKYTTSVILILLIAFNIFQSWQVRNDLIHQISMTKKSYWLNFLKTESHSDYYNNLVNPNYPDAIKGIYYSEKEITEGERKQALSKNLATKEDSINFYKQRIINDIFYYNFIRDKARQQNRTIEEVIERDATWLYERETKHLKVSED